MPMPFWAQSQIDRAILDGPEELRVAYRYDVVIGGKYLGFLSLAYQPL